MSTPFKETATVFFKEIVPFPFQPEASGSCSVVEGWGQGEGSRMWGGARVVLRDYQCQGEYPGFCISLPRSGAEEKEGVVRVKSCKPSDIRKMELDSLLFTPDV